MKVILKVIGSVCAALLTLMIIFAAMIYYFFFSAANLPTGEFIGEAISPDGSYTARAYVSNGGATVAYAVRGEVVQHHKGNKTKNIYWGYREEHAEIVWLDGHTVSINGRELDVRTDVYDWRKVE